MLEVAETMRGAGGQDEATLRLLAVYADSLRRIAKAEAEYYETNIERRLRATGLDERRLSSSAPASATASSACSSGRSS